MITKQQCSQSLSIVLCSAISPAWFIYLKLQELKYWLRNKGKIHKGKPLGTRLRKWSCRSFNTADSNHALGTLEIPTVWAGEKGGAGAGRLDPEHPTSDSYWVVLSILFILDLPLKILCEEQINTNCLRATALGHNPPSSCFHIWVNWAPVNL